MCSVRFDTAVAAAAAAGRKERIFACFHAVQRESQSEEADGGKTLGMRVTAGIKGTSGLGTWLDFQKRDSEGCRTCRSTH